MKTTKNAKEDNRAEIEARIARLAQLNDEDELDLGVGKPLDLLALMEPGYNVLKLYEAARHAEVKAQREEGRPTGWGPLVGMPVTYHIGSDSHAGEVTKVTPNRKRISVRILGLEQVFTWRSAGRYQPKASESGYLEFLRAVTSLDPCF